MTKLMHRLNRVYYGVVDYFRTRKYRKLYPDYIEDDEYNLGELKHIWGVTSCDELCTLKSNLYTMNDIDITYDRKTKKYFLGIETAYMFKTTQNECKYLKQLLKIFTDFMDDNSYNKNFDMCLFMRSPEINCEADSIEELYANFSIYVNGFCSFYGYE